MLQLAPRKRRLIVLLVSVVISIFIFACALLEEDAIPLRSDLPTRGLEAVVEYNLNGPAGSQKETNVSILRGVNFGAPHKWMETRFGKVSGTSTEDVYMDDVQVLGMAETDRGLGYTRSARVDQNTFDIRDPETRELLYCGATIRLRYNRNLAEYPTRDRNDYDVLFRYKVPCEEVPNEPEAVLHMDQAELYSLTVNEVFQMRIAWGSFFWNWGHSVTVVEGLPTEIEPLWWEVSNIPGEPEKLGKENDIIGVARFLDVLINDLSTSASPWLEFTEGGLFDKSGSYLIFSAADADQYNHFDRLLLNRQHEYAVFFRPPENEELIASPETPWEWITIAPRYNWEWNDAGQRLATVQGWIGNNKKDPFQGKLNEDGTIREGRGHDPVITELEKMGWMNAPNAALDQIQFKNQAGDVIYAITIRAFWGANDTLIIYGDKTASLDSVKKAADVENAEIPPRPVLYDKKGRRLNESQQDFSEKEWAEFIREATIWNWLKDNPSHLGADTFIQYRFRDNSEWAPIPCSDGGICGWKPMEWDLSATYYFEGDTRKAWLITNLLGEVGMRSLGFSYCSGRFEGTGMHFALGQKTFYEEVRNHTLNPESVWILNARAMQLPGYLAESWAAVHDYEYERPDIAVTPTITNTTN